MWLKILLIILAIVILLILITSYYLSKKVLHPKRVCLEKSMHIENKAGRINKDEYNKLIKEDLNIKSTNGYDLDTTIIYREGINRENIIKDKEKVIIFVHGYEYNKIGSLKYFEIFRSRDFNIVMYDHRNSGNSGGNSTTMGYIEKHDLKTVINEVKSLFGQNAIIGLHGESMGASTSLLTLEIEDNINFIIADCGYSNLKEELSYHIKKQYKVPSFPFINISSIFNKLLVGYKYEDILPIESIKKYGLKVPILFIHGDSDNFTPCKMSEDMYKARKESVDKNVCTMIYIGKNSDHTETYWNNKKECDAVIGRFLEEAL